MIIATATIMAGSVIGSANATVQPGVAPFSPERISTDPRDLASRVKQIAS